MSSLKRLSVIGVFFVLLAGTLAHFLYDLSGENAFVGLFVPVNESVWEHMKLLFVPLFLFTIVVKIVLFPLNLKGKKERDQDHRAERPAPGDPEAVRQ